MEGIYGRDDLIWSISSGTTSYFHMSGTSVATIRFDHYLRHNGSGSGVSSIVSDLITPVERETLRIKYVELPVIKYIPGPVEYVTVYVTPEPSSLILKEGKEMSYTNTGFIVAVIIISLITYKFILPRMSWRYLIRKFKNWVWKPASKEVSEIKNIWNERDGFFDEEPPSDEELYNTKVKPRARKKVKR